MKNAPISAMVPHAVVLLRDTATSPAPFTRPMKSILFSVLALGVAFGAYAQDAAAPAAADAHIDMDIDMNLDSDFDAATSDVPAAAPPPDAPMQGVPIQGAPIQDAPIRDSADALGETEIDLSSFDASAMDGEPPAVDAGSTDASSNETGSNDASSNETSSALLSDPSAPVDSPAAPGGDDINMEDGGEVSEGRLADFMKSARISLKHETSYKFASPKRVVNNRSSVRLEYSKPLTSNLYLRLDTKLNLHWDNDHRAKAKDEDLFRELVTREAYLQSSFGNTSLRLGYQILPWGVSEGGAITDEVSPRNSSEFFFIPLEDSRVGQPMLAMDHFGDSGHWTAFFVPQPGYNKYPDRGSEYDIPGAFDRNAPNDDWGNAGNYEFGARWKRSFGKSDFSLMAARLIDNDYLVRQQRFRMYGLTANVAVDNLLLRAEVALKQPRAFFARSADSSGLTVVESDQFDSSFGFDYSPGGRALTYSAEVVWSRLLDWRNDIVGRERDEYSLVGSVSNRFFNNDLTLSWLTIYTRPYTSLQHRFLSSYLIDDNSTVYFELFYPDERDERSGTWPYRDQKQFVIRYQYQF